MINQTEEGGLRVVAVACDGCRASLPAMTFAGEDIDERVAAILDAHKFALAGDRVLCAACAARAPAPPVRPTIDHVLMISAQAWAMRGTCCRKAVGAVIAVDGRGVSTGYNGSLPGQPHCTDAGVGCLMEEGHCVRTVHAELNAILNAAKNGIATNGGTVYTTASPCFPCFKAIVMAGIKRVVFAEIYRDPRIKEWAAAAKIELVHLVAT